jgi:hypothetical protein
LAYKALVEKQSRHQIQRLTTDNGGEYVNKNFTSYCTTQGIQMQHTVPYTPQENGVAERKNHTLKEMANCMIQSKGLSLLYWAEAINCANYIVNHTPTKALKNITPEEAWTKIKPDVSHFCVFGSIAWAHIPDEKRKALQPKSEKCIFFGYCENVKDPVQHQRRKHIELHMHFIRKLIHDQIIEVLFCPTEDQVADIFTKSLTEAKFSKLRSMLGVQEVVIKGVYALMPPSFSYCVIIINPSILSQVVLKRGC